MLPMKEVLLEYITQKYEQKEHNHFVPYPYQNGQYPNGMYGKNINGPNGILNPGINGGGMNQEEFLNVNNMIDRDLRKYQDDEHSLLEDEYDPNDPNYNDEDTFGQDMNPTNNDKDYSLLLSGDSDSVSHDSHSAENHNNDSLLEKKSGSDNDEGIQEETQTDDSKKLSKTKEENKDKDPAKNLTGGTVEVNPSDQDNNALSASDHGLKMIDISGAISKKGVASTYFVETLPEIKKRLNEYKKDRKNKKSSPIDTQSKNKLKEDKEDKESEADEDIQITRTVSDSAHDDKNKKSKKEKQDPKKKARIEKDTNDLIDDVLRA